MVDFLVCDGFLSFTGLSGCLHLTLQRRIESASYFYAVCPIETMIVLVLDVLTLYALMEISDLATISGISYVSVTLITRALSLGLVEV